jgi:hypothetical protein
MNCATVVKEIAMIGYPVVGRSFEHPKKELFYFLETSIRGYVELHRPGNGRRKFSDRAEDFREYGKALAARVNPELVPLSLRRRHAARVRLVAEADRDWDIRVRLHDAIFPILQYRAFGAAAFLSESLGNLDDARAFAKQALSAAALTESPFRSHRTLGLVEGSDEEVQRRLWHLARSVY